MRAMETGAGIADTGTVATAEGVGARVARGRVSAGLGAQAPVTGASRSAGLDRSKLRPFIEHPSPLMAAYC